MLHLVPGTLLLGTNKPYNRSSGPPCRLLYFCRSPHTGAPPLNYLSFRVWWEPSLHNNRGSGLLIANFSTPHTFHHLSSHRRLFCRKRNHFLRQFFAAARLVSHLRLGCWWSVLLWKPQFFGDRPLPRAAIRNDTHAQCVCIEHRFKMRQVTKNHNLDKIPYKYKT